MKGVRTAERLRAHKQLAAIKLVIDQMEELAPRLRKHWVLAEIDECVNVVNHSIRARCEFHRPRNEERPG